MHVLANRSPVTELAAHNVTVTTEVVVKEDVSQAIIQAAEYDRLAQGAVPGEQGIIVMATHGRGGIGRWAVGSKTERVLSACKVPLLIVKPQRVNARHSPSVAIATRA